MKKLNRNGFTVFELIITTVVLVVIAGAGYGVWHIRNSKTTASNTSSKDTATKTYSQDNTSFTYNSPANFKAVEDGGTLRFESPNYEFRESGAPAVLKGESIDAKITTRDGVDPEGVPLHITADNYLTVSFSDPVDRRDVLDIKTATINGVKTLQYTYRGTKTTIFFIADSKRITVKLSYPEGSPVTEHDETYNMFVSSIKLQ